MTCCNHRSTAANQVSERLLAVPASIHGGHSPIVLATDTTEHCAIVRFGDVVVKFLHPEIYPHNRDRVIRSWQVRAEVAGKHPDLFAPIDFNSSMWWVIQPYIAGRIPTGDEKKALLNEVLNVRDLPYVRDFGGNILVTDDGRVVIVDFAVLEELKARLERVSKRHRRR